jgi:hypothetical protein
MAKRGKNRVRCLMEIFCPAGMFRIEFYWTHMLLKSTPHLNHCVTPLNGCLGDALPEKQIDSFICGRCFFLLTASKILAHTSGLVCHQNGWWKVGRGPPLTHKRAVSYLPLLPICHLTSCLFRILVLLPLQLFTYHLVSFRFSLVLQPPILIIHISESNVNYWNSCHSNSLFFTLQITATFFPVHSSVFLLMPLFLQFYHTVCLVGC